MQPEVIPQLPEIFENERFDIDEVFISTEFETARNKFVFYDTENGECRFRYDELDEKLFASLVVQLSQSHHNKLYDFLKLVMEAVRLVKQGTKKGLLQAVSIEKYIKKISKSNKRLRPLISSNDESQLKKGI